MNPPVSRSDLRRLGLAVLRSDVSRLFAQPETGTIAVKVINDQGDEVMQVFEV